MDWQGENFGVALKALAGAIEPLKPGDIAGQMQRNTPEYLLAYFGCIKAGLTPVNVNYRYKDRELADIFERFNVKLVFAESDFASLAAQAMPSGDQVIDVGSSDWAAAQRECPKQ